MSFTWAAGPFFYIRRRAGTLSAALGVLLLWVSHTFYYATEARPYALMFLCFAFLLLSWDTAIRSKRRGMALAGVAVANIGLLAADPFGPLSLFPFLVAELLRWRRRRVPDYPLWACLILPSVVMLAYIPLIRVYHGVLIPTADQASGAQITEFFDFSIQTVSLAFFLAVLALLILPEAKAAIRRDLPVSQEDLAIFVCLLFNPVFLNVLFMLRHGGFYDRYCITTDVAIDAALAILLGVRLQPGRAAGWVAIVAVLAGGLYGQRFSRTLKVDPTQPVPWAKFQTGLPLVAANGLTFYEMNHYESPQLLSRLYYLQDRAASIKYEHSNYFQDFDAPDQMKAAGLPILANVEPYSVFVRQHHQFLLFGNTGDWLMRLLHDEGATEQSLGDFSATAPYPRDSHLYLVTMPPG